MRLCVSSRGKSNVCHNKKFSLVSFRDIDRTMYPKAMADSVVLDVSSIIILPLFFDSLMAGS